MATTKRKSGSSKGKSDANKGGGSSKGKGGSKAEKGRATKPKRTAKKGDSEKSVADAGAGVCKTAVPGDGVGAEQPVVPCGEAQTGKPKRATRPGVTYRKRAPEIAVELADRAEGGSYLHARELRQMAILDDSRCKKRGGRRSSGLVKVLLDRLDQMSGGSKSESEAACATDAKAGTTE